MTDPPAPLPPASIEIADLDYPLPPELIAQHPLPERDGARLLVIDRASGSLADHRIGQLPELLREHDLLVLNDARVLPARLAAHRRTGGRVSGLFIREHRQGVWQVLLQGSRRLRQGELLTARPVQGEPVELELLDALPEGLWMVRVHAEGTAEQILGRIGRTPLPPYIRRGDKDDLADEEDRARYQTVYAAKPGAIAAPTAGLHLTPRLLDRLHGAGVRTAFVTLYVGLGTFKPIAASTLPEHAMHEERFDLPAQTAADLAACRARGGRVVAVGTTSVRVLEAAAAPISGNWGVEATNGTTRLYIYPPYQFRVVDALLTNFHLPRSTLLALVMAFGGTELTRRAYAHAVDQRYRFYSYGDAMLIQ